MSHDPVLLPLPTRFASTRDALHRLAVYLISPARRAATGNEIALAITDGGFGTPSGDSWGQVRVETGEVVVRRGGRELRQPITSLRAASRFVGVELDLAALDRFDVPAPGDVDADLRIDAESGTALAAWNAFAWEVLDELGARLDPSDDASPPHLWPEHFDVAIDAGDERRGRRGSWGFSPGDRAHPAPYAYVSLWAGAPAGQIWGETSFSGASIGYAELLASGDARQRVLRFFDEARRQLDPIV